MHFGYLLRMPSNNIIINKATNWNMNKKKKELGRCQAVKNKTFQSQTFLLAKKTKQRKKKALTRNSSAVRAACATKL